MGAALGTETGLNEARGVPIGLFRLGTGAMDGFTEEMGVAEGWVREFFVP